MVASRMLRLDDIHCYYGKSYILQGVSLEVGPGSLVGLLGRNGMGKTTALRAIMGLNPPRSGRISFKDRSIEGLEPHVISRRGIGFVPQGRHIFPSLSAKENLTMSARPSGREGAWSLARVYKLFPILAEREKLPGALLSGGEQQMLAIARALMTNPELLLMDEPSEGLSPMMVKEISRVIAGLKQEGISILLVEQNLPMALDLADHVYVLSNGRIAYEGTSRDFQRDEDARQRCMGVG